MDKCVRCKKGIDKLHSHNGRPLFIGDICKECNELVLNVKVRLLLD